MKVLIVDDEMYLHVALIDELEKCEITVIKALDGEMGLKFYQEERPDIIITDTNMPKLNGPAVAKAILKLNKDAVIISCSNNPQPNLKFPVGIPFLQKPLSLKQIESVLKSLALF